MWKNIISVFVMVILMIFGTQARSKATAESGDIDNTTIGSSVASVKSKAKRSLVPEHFEVRQNYPNPFNATTTIEYNLPEGAGVYAVVYNIFGHRIKTLKNNLQKSGKHKLEWDGTTTTGLEVASGVYFYVLLADENYSIGKMLLLK